MRIQATDSRGWTTSRKDRTRGRALLLLFVLSTLGGLFTSATPPGASADDLSDAYARQRALEKLISKQKTSISELAASQKALSLEISSTKDDLRALNANLLVVRTQIVSMTVDVARSQSSVDELVATAGRLDAQLLEVQAEETRKQTDLAAAKALLATRIPDADETHQTSGLGKVL